MTQPPATARAEMSGWVEVAIWVATIAFLFEILIVPMRVFATGISIAAFFGVQPSAAQVAAAHDQAVMNFWWALTALIVLLGCSIVAWRTGRFVGVGTAFVTLATVVTLITGAVAGTSYQ
ncbi:MAG TPA: hypothetical protein VIL55_15635 [Naasia sp.]